ncbi:hypothetical protein T440DRAFT_89913 [Plenodomus tracheiphilus IPT5]|uniref:Uncharacterized protein n=1 Tax=Plenodomus tracheiphilus IPT5 TaxID=1408161 RepID=A0A6A7B566_9PLEO|nr:hypothetical protein T440DRAFT_89913 [Plenodomus tracheiphilus IPT5]
MTLAVQLHAVRGIFPRFSSRTLPNSNGNSNGNSNSNSNSNILHTYRPSQKVVFNLTAPLVAISNRPVQHQARYWGQDVSKVGNNPSTCSMGADLARFPAKSTPLVMARRSFSSRLLASCTNRQRFGDFISTPLRTAGSIVYRRKGLRLIWKLTTLSSQLCGIHFTSRSAFMHAENVQDLIHGRGPALRDVFITFVKGVLDLMAWKFILLWPVQPLYLDRVCQLTNPIKKQCYNRVWHFRPLSGTQSSGILSSQLRNYPMPLHEWTALFALGSRPGSICPLAMAQWLAGSLTRSRSVWPSSGLGHKDLQLSALVQFINDR